jgi:signal transduction histidine kinase/CheY-like chemotaxis protein
MTLTNKSSGRRLFGQRSLRADDDDFLFQYLVEHCPAAVVLARISDDRIVFESALTQQLFNCQGPRTGEHLEKQWSSRRGYVAFKDRFLSSGAVDGVEVRMQRNQGEEFWCAVSAREIEVDGEAMIFLGMVDLTDSLADKAKIARQRDALHDAEKLSSMGELLGGISHELSNPLSVLVGQALMLKEKAHDDATAIRAERISKAADRASRIVRSFLDLVRQEPSEPIAIDLNEVVIDVLDSTGNALRASNIDVVLELPSELPRVMADPNQIRQVVVNLVVNAQQALESVEDKRRLSIRTVYASEKGDVVLRVSDNGPGISEEISSRVFDPLFTTKAPGKGTGLGLALCRRIIELNKGTIELESSSARGTTFVVTFSQSAGLPAEASEPVRVSQKGPGKFEILVVDEDVDAGVHLSEMLAGQGHGVEVVESGFVGLQRVRRKAFGVLFFRAGLSGQNARNLLRSIDEARPGMASKVVYIVERDIDHAELIGLDQIERPYLTEPLRESDVKDVIELLSLRAVG